MSSYPKNWPEIAERAKHRQNYTCQDCNYKGRKLVVHHIIPKSFDGPDEIWNLRTLCSYCHGLYPGDSHIRIGEGKDYSLKENYTPKVRAYEKAVLRKMYKLQNFYHPSPWNERKTEITLLKKTLETYLLTGKKDKSVLF